MSDLAPIPAEEFERRQKKVLGARHAFRRTTTCTIMSTEYPSIRWVVSGYIAEGLAILAGRQKLGKTWLAIDWAIAVASGGYAMGSVSCEEGDVLYIDMENGHRRIQRRIRTLFPYETSTPDLSRLQWVTEAPSLDNGFIACLDEWRLSVSAPRLVIIDVLQRVKPVPKGNQNAYESDYSALAELQKWAMVEGIAVVVLHHVRKAASEDPLEQLSGSNGLSACADTTLVLDRNPNGISLYVRGRDVEEQETALNFSGGIWSVVGQASEVRRSDERVTIAVTLEQSPEPMSPSEIADVTGMKSGNVRKLLFHMARAGEVQKSGRGRYIHPRSADEKAATRDPR